MNNKEPTQDSAKAQEDPSTHMEDAVSIAGLLRDRKTGEMIVKVGDQEYSKAADIEDADVRVNLEIAAADLIQWISPRDATKPLPQEAVSSKPEQADAKPKGMIEGINEILERRGSIGEAPQGLKLFTGLKGMVRVYVGVESYEVDDVPDKKISRVIKEAVEEWEARQ